MVSFADLKVSGCTSSFERLDLAIKRIKQWCAADIACLFGFYIYKYNQFRVDD